METGIAHPPKQVHMSSRVHMTDKRHIYILRKGLLWFNVWLKQWKGLKLGVKKSFFLVCNKLFCVWKNMTFWKILVIQTYTCWIYLDLDLNLVHINLYYPVKREWSEANWLVPFIHIFLNISFMLVHSLLALLAHLLNVYMIAGLLLPIKRRPCFKLEFIQPWFFYRPSSSDFCLIPYHIPCLLFFILYFIHTLPLCFHLETTEKNVY